MKKVVLTLIGAGLGYAAWLKVQADRQNQAVWEEVTDPVPSA